MLPGYTKDARAWLAADGVLKCAIASKPAPTKTRLRDTEVLHRTVGAGSHRGIAVGLTMRVVTGAATIIVVMAMVSAAVGEYDAAAQGQQGQQGNQQCDSTQHL